jgi:hypothetical protein
MHDLRRENPSQATQEKEEKRSGLNRRQLGLIPIPLAGLQWYKHEKRVIRWIGEGMEPLMNLVERVLAKKCFFSCGNEAKIP